MIHFPKYDANDVPTRRSGKLVINGMTSSEVAIIVWHIESRPNFRRLPLPSLERKSFVSKRYPTSKEEATVLAALTLYMVDIVWWSTPTCL